MFLGSTGLNIIFRSLHRLAVERTSDAPPRPYEIRPRAGSNWQHTRLFGTKFGWFEMVESILQQGIENRDRRWMGALAHPIGQLFFCDIRTNSEGEAGEGAGEGAGPREFKQGSAM